MNKSVNNIIFYDGDCGFCNASVQFILKKRKINFFFTPLQSQWATDTLGEHNIKVDMATIYYKKDDKIYERSSAALMICKGLKGCYPALLVFWVIPKFLRDIVYNMIAKRRHKIKAGYCAIPTEEEKQFFV